MKLRGHTLGPYGAILLITLISACGDSSDSAPTTTSQQPPPTSARPAPTFGEPPTTTGPAGDSTECEAADGSTEGGPVSIQIKPLGPVPATIGPVKTEATITNTSETPLRLHGEGGDLLYGFLTDPTGAILSAPEPHQALEGANPRLEPGQSLDWPTLLWLERCGVARGNGFDPGSYTMRIRVIVEDEDGYRNLLSAETFPIELTEP